jgi:diadenosine tetraphosphate (Ap4A) HIT family hydrolase
LSKDQFSLYDLPMAFIPPEHLIIAETEHWRINHRVDSHLPGYLMVGAKAETTNLFELAPAALAELGPLLARTQEALTDLFHPDHIYIGRYGHTEGHSIHFHVIPIYSWVKDAFATDPRYRILQSFYNPDVPTSNPDGGELTLYVWREFCESKNPPKIHGPSVSEAIGLLRECFSNVPPLQSI